jgi:hypothetical protein
VEIVVRDAVRSTEIFSLSTIGLKSHHLSDSWGVPSFLKIDVLGYSVFSPPAVLDPVLTPGIGVGNVPATSSATPNVMTLNDWVDVAKLILDLSFGIVGSPS